MRLVICFFFYKQNNILLKGIKVAQPINITKDNNFKFKGNSKTSLKKKKKKGNNITPTY